MPQPRHDPPPDAVTALILDDSRIDRRRLLRLLREAGLAVAATEAADLAGFAAALDAGPFHLAFIDYALPDGSGLEALEMLGAHPQGSGAAPVMITGHGQLDIAVQAMRRGCVDYIAKDQLSAAELRRAVRAAVERRFLPAATAGRGAPRRAAMEVLSRFDAAAADQLQQELAEMLMRARGIRTRAEDRRRFFEDVAAIETSCARMYSLLADGAPGREPAAPPH